MDKSSSLRLWLLAATMLTSAGPGAAEVVLTFGLEQELQIGRNVDLTAPEEGQTMASITRLSFGAVSRTPVDVLEFTAVAALEVEDAADSDTTADFGRPDLGLRYTREVPSGLFTVGVQYRSDDVDTFDEDLIDAGSGGRRTDTSADLRLETGRTSPLGFVFSTEYRKSEYDDTSDPDLVDTEVALFGIESRLRFSDVLEGRAALGYERETRDDAPSEVIESKTALVGATYLLPNGTVSADLIFRTDDEEDDRTTFILGRTLILPAASVTARLGVTRGDVGGSDVVGSLSWTQDLPNGAVDLLLERSVTFDEDSVESVVSTLFSLGLSQEVTGLSSLGLSLSHEIEVAPSERVELSQVSAIYRHALTDDWDLESGVRYRMREDENGRSDSPDIFLALSRSFETRP